MINWGDYGDYQGQLYSKFVVRGSTNDDEGAVIYAANEGTNPLFLVRNDRRVGIGTLTPTSTLQICGSGHESSTSSLNIINDESTSWFLARDDGRVGIGYITSNELTSRLVIKGSTSDLNASSLNIINSEGTSLLKVRNDGNVGIGFSSPEQKLAVNGKVRIGSNKVDEQSQYYDEYMLSVDGTVIAEKVVVSTSEWADFVFNKSYELMPLDELRNYINTNNKLPGMPSAQEVKDSGIDLGQLNAKLLQKIEELTLYILELKKENQEFRDEINKIKK